MIALEIPGFGSAKIEHLVCDYNGTLAVDGLLTNSVTDRLFRLANQVQIHVLTADTFGKVATQMSGLPCLIHILGEGNEREQKRDYIQKLGAESVIAFGNGNNDILMLEQSSVGVAVIGNEGTAGNALRAADLVVNDILHGLDLLLHPLRLKATLRY